MAASPIVAVAVIAPKTTVPAATPPPPAANVPPPSHAKTALEAAAPDKDDMAVPVLAAHNAVTAPVTTAGVPMIPTAANPPPTAKVLRASDAFMSTDSISFISSVKISISDKNSYSFPFAL